jgi:hypothetical protein
VAVRWVRSAGRPSARGPAGCSLLSVDLQQPTATTFERSTDPLRRGTSNTSPTSLETFTCPIRSWQLVARSGCERGCGSVRRQRIPIWVLLREGLQGDFSVDVGNEHTTNLGSSCVVISGCGRTPRACRKRRSCSLYVDRATASVSSSSRLPEVGRSNIHARPVRGGRLGGLRQPHFAQSLAGALFVRTLQARPDFHASEARRAPLSDRHAAPGCPRPRSRRFPFQKAPISCIRIMC